MAGTGDPGGGPAPMTQASGGSAPVPGTGGAPSSGTGGAAPATGGRAAGSGGAPSSGTGGAAAAPDAPVDLDPPEAGVPDAPGITSGQGPIAEGTIVYSQDFESGQHPGITFSPTNLPVSRAMVVDDPLGQRGKVIRMQWLPGDNYRIGQYRPRANISNTGFYYNEGDRISYAWGYMTESTYIGATLAQNITGGDPIWMLRGRADGELDVIPGGNGLLPYKLEAKKWYDIRAEIYYARGAAGTVDIYINGTRVFSRKGGLPIGPRAHWDGGIYLTSFGQTGAGNSTPRTVYVSNLSVGKK